MRKTAVDYLFNEIWDRPKDKMVWFYIFEKAKQIEKEQIEEAYWLATINWESKKNAEEYYEETYGKNA
jgi:hypothetical protein